MATLLEGLKLRSVIASMGDGEAIAGLQVRGAPLRHPLILAGTASRERVLPIRAAVADPRCEPPVLAVDRVLVAFGLEFLRRIDRRVAAEVGDGKTCRCHSHRRQRRSQAGPTSHGLASGC